MKWLESLLAGTIACSLYYKILVYNFATWSKHIVLIRCTVVDLLWHWPLISYLLSKGLLARLLRVAWSVRLHLTSTFRSTTITPSPLPTSLFTLSPSTSPQCSTRAKQANLSAWLDLCTIGKNRQTALVSHNGEYKGGHRQFMNMGMHLYGRLPSFCTLLDEL